MEPRISVWKDALLSLPGVSERELDLPTVARPTADGIRFAVDEVTPATDPCPALARRRVLTGLAGGERLHAWSFRGPFVASTCDHPLVAATQRAYLDHRPLVLTPDAVWLTLAHGIALHVDLHADVLRERVVTHEGRRRVTIDGPADGALDRAGWEKAVRVWCALVEAETCGGFADLFACDFSTTTPEAVVASKVVMLSALRRYFELRMVLICGIPEIEVKGTPADWRRIRSRVDRLWELDLGWWAQRLRPVLDAFVETAEGRPDLAFWSQIWLPKQVYGGERIIGWIGELFPYIRSGRAWQPVRRNPLFSTTYKERLLSAGAALRGAADPVPGLHLGDFPGALSVAPLVQVRGDASRRDLELVGGLVGVRQSGLDLEPVAGWLVRGVPPLRSTLLRLRDVGSPVAPPAPPDDDVPCSPELLQLAVEVGGVRLRGATLLAASQWTLARRGDELVTCFATLPGGRVLGVMARGRSWQYVRGRIHRGALPTGAEGRPDDQARLVAARTLGGRILPLLRYMLSGRVRCVRPTGWVLRPRVQARDPG